MSSGSSKPPTPLVSEVSGSSLADASISLHSDALNYDPYKEEEMAPQLYFRTHHQEFDLLEENNYTITATAMSDIMIDETEDIQTTETLRLNTVNGSLREPCDEGSLNTTVATISCPTQTSNTLRSPTYPDGLDWPRLETRQRLGSTVGENEKRLQKLKEAVRTILECVGEDPEREGLRDTPKRYAKAMLYFTKGYGDNIRDLVNGAVFHENHDELVIVKDIDVFSLCEHHMVPFTGKMHIGYIPDGGRVLGLSKLARLAEMFSRRLQVQERLTKQVAQALSDVLNPQGVGVVMQSSHLCMAMRGVQKVGSITTTRCMLGCMRSCASHRQEFFASLDRR
ncbi:hypothetical protein N7445_007806 [Penicillium cf. griseofulvum]|nr:hypothetical protein N7445_007806 [Penicillium cf. griseofulvum]